MNASEVFDIPEGIILTRQVAKVFGYEAQDEPQYVNSVPRPGDAMILQGERLNVMSQLLELPDADDLPHRGYSIKAPITASQKEAVLAKFHSRWAATRRVKDEGLSDHLNASLVDAKAHMGTLGNRRMPITPSSGR